jgi:glycine/D-amino acid oxidase-like deaminating enzyme
MLAQKAFDLVVVGGGVVGSSTAWAAARAGARVCLLEQFSLLHDRGSSHGDGRIYRYGYAEDHYARMMHGGLRGWRELEELMGALMVMANRRQLPPPPS